MFWFLSYDHFRWKNQKDVKGTLLCDMTISQNKFEFFSSNKWNGYKSSGYCQ